MRTLEKLMDRWDAMPRVRTCLWYSDRAEEAAAFYTEIVPNSRFEGVLFAEENKPSVIGFHLGGSPYLAFNGGPMYRHSPASSILVMTEDQTSTDQLWSSIMKAGGKPGARGWCTDHYGVTWQVIPKAVVAMLNCGDYKMVDKIFAAMAFMTKLDIEGLAKVYEAGP